jgi:hypothetical protein
MADGMYRSVDQCTSKDSAFRFGILSNYAVDMCAGVASIWIAHYKRSSFSDCTTGTRIDLQPASPFLHLVRTSCRLGRSGDWLRPLYASPLHNDWDICASFEFGVGGFGGSRAGVSPAQRSLEARSPSKMIHG